MLFALPELGIVALGVGILMIAGEFDLSVGSVFALSPHADGRRHGQMGRARPSSPSCWASASPWRSATSTAGSRWPSASRASSPRWACCSWPARSPTVLSGGFPPPFPANTPTWLFVADLGQFRASMLWYAAFAVILGVMLHFSNLGNWIFATGGQRQAADDMGIDTRRVKLFCFMLCSFLAGFAGMITTFRLKSALPALGEGLELQAIAAAVIGGTALTGGIGSVIGIIVGTCLIRGDRQWPGHGADRRQLVPLRDRCAHHRRGDPEHHRAPARAADAVGPAMTEALVEHAQPKRDLRPAQRRRADPLRGAGEMVRRRPRAQGRRLPRRAGRGRGPGRRQRRRQVDPDQDPLRRAPAGLRPHLRRGQGGPARPRRRWR